MTIPGRSAPLDKRFEVGMDLLCLKNKNGARWAGGMDRGKRAGFRKEDRAPERVWVSFCTQGETTGGC